MLFYQKRGWCIWRCYNWGRLSYMHPWSFRGFWYWYGKHRLSICMITGGNWVKVQETIKVSLFGKPGKGNYAQQGYSIL